MNRHRRSIVCAPALCIFIAATLAAGPQDRFAGATGARVHYIADGPFNDDVSSFIARIK
jgi:hypothetical protein